MHRRLPVIVVAGSGPSLLGRNWLATMKLNWSEVHAVRTPPLERLKGRYPSVFRPELGQLKDVELKLGIDRTVPPKFCKARSLPYAVKAKVEEQLDADIASDVLVPVKDGEWAAPIIPVIKPGGKVRVCANFKLTANRAVRLDRYPLPKVEDMFATLGGHSLFSKIDLAQAYNQLRVHKASRDVLTINTSRGLLQYSRLPFGVNCAGGQFQREIEKVLRGIPHVVVYLDDVLIASQTEEEHWRRLDQVFQRLESTGLRVRESKCLLMQPRVEYLGHKLDRSGIRPLDDKVRAILSTPAPSNVAELKSFLGLVTYYSRFIPQRAMMLAPLYDLLRKEAEWTWGRAEEDSFQECKRKLAAKTLLVHFDASRDLILTCDASSRGIGAVLAHVGDRGEELPLGFASRRLTDAERKYSQIEREALAIIMGVTKFHQYLCGLTKPFHLVTDHKPLIKLFGQHEELPEMASGRIRRWALKLSNYNYVIQFRRTDDIPNADALSRLPSPLESGPAQEELVLLMEPEWLDARDMARLTSRDPALSSVLRFVRCGNWPSNGDGYLKAFRGKRHELSLSAGVLLWGHRVVVPDAARRMVLQELHAGHPGIVRMKAAARAVVWWPGIDDDIERTVRLVAPARSLDVRLSDLSCICGRGQASHGPDFTSISRNSQKASTSSS